MATEGLKAIITKALSDVNYRKQLLDNPEDALQGYELAENEVTMLRNLKPEAFEEIEMDVEKRQSKSGLAMGLGSLISGRDTASEDIGLLVDLMMNKYG